MKRFAKLISLVLVVSIISGVCAVGAAAASRPWYLLLGDSIAYGQGLSNPQEACYGKIVANTNKYSYMNDAISGITSTVLLSLLSEDLIKNDVKKADIITISIGGNDFLTKNWVGMGAKGIITGNYKSLDPIAKTYQQNLISIVKKIRSLNSDATLIIQTIYNPHNDRYHNAFQQGVDRINNAIRAARKATNNTFEIANVGRVMDGHSEYIAVDTIHPNAAGNIAIATYMLKMLKALKLGTATTPVIKVKPKNRVG